MGLILKKENKGLDIWREMATYPFYKYDSIQGYKFIFSLLEKKVDEFCFYLYLLSENKEKLVLESTNMSEIEDLSEKSAQNKELLEIYQQPESSIKLRESHRQIIPVKEWGGELLNIPLLINGEEFIGTILCGPLKNEKISGKEKKELEKFSVAAASAISNLKRTSDLLAEIQKLDSSAEVRKRMLGSALEVNRFVDLLLDLALTATKAEAGFVAITDSSEKNMTVRAHKNLPDGFAEKMNLNSQNGMFEWSEEDSEVLILSDYDFVAEYKVKSILAVPLVEKKKLIGVFALMSFDASEMFSEFSLSVLTNFTEQIKLVLNNTKLFENFTTRYFDTLVAMSRAYDHRSPFTTGHSGQVSNVAAEIAYQMKFSAEEIKNISQAGLIHDVGMCGVVEITDGFQADYNHPEIGASMIEVLPISKDIIEAVRTHHEWNDGWGFPNGLKGDEIPMSGRILAIADYFADITSNSKARKAFSLKKVLEDLELRREKQFDEKVVEELIKILEKKQNKKIEETFDFCWKFKGEPEDVCENCPAFQQKNVYCWGFPGVLCEKHGDNSCDDCFIFNEWIERVETLIQTDKIEVKNMEHKVLKKDGFAVVQLSGEIDVSVAPQLRNALKELIDSGTVNLVVDLSEVAFIDSSGLGIFVVAYKLAKTKEGTIRFAAARPEVLKVIKLTRLDKHLQLFETVEQAGTDF
ncbi:hypothetical protein B6I21_00385 [candidate division KSB1 bacterium 4572_119]|nr:MAG: hypothetical protein B6I21_00385 [candidate division KSB1 bacterium 4572_119]